MLCLLSLAGLSACWVPLVPLWAHTSSAPGAAWLPTSWAVAPTIAVARQGYHWVGAEWVRQGDGWRLHSGHWQRG